MTVSSDTDRLSREEKMRTDWERQIGQCGVDYRSRKDRIEQMKRARRQMKLERRRAG